LCFCVKYDDTGGTRRICGECGLVALRAPGSYGGRVDRTELAVWRVPGAEPSVGVVLHKTTKNVRTVRWDDGREQKVAAKDPVIRFAFRDTHRFKWLLDPDILESDLASDATDAFVAVLQDERGPLSSRALKKAVTDVGIDDGVVAAAWARAKPSLIKHEHLIVAGDSFQWSDEVVDPYAALRELSPEEALQRLLKGSVKPDVKVVLADVIRAAFKS
jgi:hypothetical protein